MKAVPALYTLLMKTIYLSHSAQAAEGTVFKKNPVASSSYIIYGQIWLRVTFFKA